MDELSEADRLTVERARKAQRFFSQPFHVATAFTLVPGIYVTLEETLSSFKALSNGDMDHIPEEAFYFQAGMDGVVERAELLALALKGSSAKSDADKTEEEIEEDKKKLAAAALYQAPPGETAGGQDCEFCNENHYA